MAKTFRYPLKNIDASDDYLLIESYEYVPPGLSLGTDTFSQKSSDDVGYGSKSSRGTVILPIPEGIQDNNSASWGSNNMGPIQTATMGTAMGIIGSGNPIAEGATSISTLISKLGAASKTAIGQDLSQTFFAATATEALTGNGDFNQALSRQTGAVFNSNTELLFNGISLRGGFVFSFDMVPRSRTEYKSTS